MTKPRKPKPPPTRELWGIKEVGVELGINRDQARSLLVAIPIAEKDGQRNLYDKELVLAAAKNRAKKNEADEGSKEWYEIEKMKRQIDKLDFELEVSKGKYISIEEVRQGYLAQVLATRKHWLEMVEKMPPLLAGLSPSSMQVKLKDYVNESFEKLRSHQFSTADLKRMLKSV
jgi:hypothetical protein